MRSWITILFVSISIVVNAQSKSTIEVLGRTRLLQNTVFGLKDSLTLEDLFAKDATYGHSSGKVETRSEAIRNIVRNRSVYEKSDDVAGYNITMQDDVAVVRHLFEATEKKEDGSESKLKLSLMLVWVKEKGKWKLLARQAIKVQ
jgi:ketosteroid isomerase-like protein